MKPVARRWEFVVVVVVDVEEKQWDLLDGEPKSYHLRESGFDCYCYCYYYCWLTFFIFIFRGQKVLKISCV